MSETEPPIHPLDDQDPFADEVNDKVSDKKRHPRLLYASVRVLIVSAACVFFGGLAAGNAAPNSTMEGIGSTIQRVGMLGMLGAFCAILVAYRASQIENVWTAMKNSSWNAPTSISDNFTLLGGLLIANVVLIVALILVQFVTAVFGILPIQILSYVLIVYSALLVTMIWWHEGFMKAYAIGALTSLVLSYAGLGTIFMMGMPGGRRGPSFIGPLITAVLPAMTGMFCATYVFVMERVQHKKPD